MVLAWPLASSALRRCARWTLPEPWAQPIRSRGDPAAGAKPSPLVRSAADVYGADMSGVVLRVRFISGDQADVEYEDGGIADDDELIDHVTSTLASDSGVLRCRHGGRLLLLFGRGVATVEVAPRGAVL